METVYIIRRRSVQYSESSDSASMIDEAVNASDRFHYYVMDGLETGRMILVRPHQKFNHDYKVFQKYSSVRGTVKNKEYRALGYADIEHACLADYGGAREFHTTDLSFRDLDGDPDFGVKFVVHGGKGP